jgi:hypothetical protein
MGEPLASANARHLESTRRWSSLDEVAEAVAAAREAGSRQVYVEVRGDRFRWSTVGNEGGYPLLRVTARFLGVDHRRISVGFRTLDDGIAILCEDPGRVEAPDRWSLLALPDPITSSVARSLIVAALRPG